MDNSPLIEVKETLRGLILRRLKFPTPESVSKLLCTILQLHELRALDMFNVPGKFRPNEVDAFIECGRFPNLERVDLGGNIFLLSQCDIKYINNFILC